LGRETLVQEWGSRRRVSIRAPGARPSRSGFAPFRHLAGPPIGNGKRKKEKKKRKKKRKRARRSQSLGRRTDARRGDLTRRLGGSLSFSGFYSLQKPCRPYSTPGHQIGRRNPGGHFLAVAVSLPGTGNGPVNKACSGLGGGGFTFVGFWMPIGLGE